jgi:hypothetical protein
MRDNPFGVDFKAFIEILNRNSVIKRNAIRNNC